MTPACFEVPREYFFSQALTASQILTGLAQRLEADGDFLLDEVVCGGANYLVSWSDIATVFLQQNPIPADDFVIDPPILYNKGGLIQISLEDVSGAGNTASILFRGRNQYPGSKAPKRFAGLCREDPKDYPFEGIIPASGQMIGEIQDLDQDAEFSLRQVLCNASFNLQFADQDRIFVQNVPTPSSFFGRAYSPQITYGAGGQILINITGTPGTTAQILFKGVNRYRVQS